MTSGVEFEEDSFGINAQSSASSISNRPIFATSNNSINIVNQVQNSNLQNYQNFFVGQSNKKVDNGSTKLPLFVRLILKSGVVKKQSHAEILIVLSIILMIIVSIYFFTQTYSAGQIQTIQIKQ